MIDLALIIESTSKMLWLSSSTKFDREKNVEILELELIKPRCESDIRMTTSTRKQKRCFDENQLACGNTFNAKFTESRDFPSFIAAVATLCYTGERKWFRKNRHEKKNHYESTDRPNQNENMALKHGSMNIGWLMANFNRLYLSAFKGSPKYYPLDTDRKTVSRMSFAGEWCEWMKLTLTAFLGLSLRIQSIPSKTSYDYSLK